MRPVTIKVREEVVQVADELVRLGIARSRNQALNIIIEAGMDRARRLIERRKKVARLVERFEREGLPYERLPTAADVEEARSR